MDVTCLASSPYFVEVIVEVITASKKILKILDLIIFFYRLIRKLKIKTRVDFYNFRKEWKGRKFVVHLFLVTLRILLKFQINFQFQ